MLISLYSYTLDHAEPEPEELTKQAPAEESIDLDLAQGKPRCILSMILDFSFKLLALY
jgi:hypothetical protein